MAYRFLLMVTVFVGLGAVYQDKPPPGHTGGFGEPTCHTCHFDGDLNDPGGTLALDGVPASYEPGRAYPITVRLTRPGIQRGGFQLAARFAEADREGQQAGRFDTEESQLAVDHLKHIAYIRHTPAATELVTPDSIRWTFTWTAPDTASGPVVFHVAANASNGDESEFGDSIYTLQATSHHPDGTTP